MSIAQTWFERAIVSVRSRYGWITCPGARRLVFGFRYSAVMPMRRISVGFRCSKPHGLRSAMTEGPKRMMIESLRRVVQPLHHLAQRLDHHPHPVVRLRSG